MVAVDDDADRGEPTPCGRTESLELARRVEQLVSDYQSNAAYQQALRLLVRREHSRAELQRKLRQRSIEPALIEPLLQRLEAEGLLSDTRYVESYIRQRRDRGYGPLRIAAELRQRGIDRANAERALRQIESDWFALALRVRQKRFNHLRADDFPNRAKAARYLQQRGFDSDQIRAALIDDEHATDM